MTKYIECEAAIALASGGCHPANVAAEIAKLPAANVRPVRHGQWKKSYADHEAFGVRPSSRYCSEYEFEKDEFLSSAKEKGEQDDGTA